MSEGATEVAHLFEEERWVIEGAASRVRIVAPLIIDLLVVVHHHLLMLLHIVDWSVLTVISLAIALELFVMVKGLIKDIAAFKSRERRRIELLGEVEASSL